MWAVSLAALLAAAPPSHDAGLIRSSGGFAGPHGGLWGDLAFHLTPGLAVRAGGDLPFEGVPRGYGLLEGRLGTWRCSGFLAAGPTLTPAAWPLKVPLSPPTPGARAEVGARVLVRWGVGFVASATFDADQVEIPAISGRLGGYLEW